MIQIDIEIKKRNRLKEVFHKIHSKSEDILFSIIQKLPEKFIPAFLMVQMEHYTNKRISELKHLQKIKISSVDASFYLSL